MGVVVVEFCILRLAKSLVSMSSTKGLERTQAHMYVTVVLLFSVQLTQRGGSVSRARSAAAPDREQFLLARLHAASTR